MMSRIPVKIRRAETDEDFAAAATLINEYAEMLDFDLGFQDFKYEIENLKQVYFPPEGALLLVDADGLLVGCGGIRNFADNICEIKRMYLKPDFRGRGIGRKMSLQLIDIARREGYKYMRLDTIDKMLVARGLYRSLGFKTIPPYRYNPIKGTVYMELEL